MRRWRQTSQSPSQKKCGNTTDSQQISSQTETPDLPEKRGRSSVGCQALGHECRRPSTHRRMAKQNTSTKQSRHTYGRLSTMNRTTGSPCSRWPSSLTTTRSRWAIECRRSMPITAATQLPLTQLPQDPSTQPVNCKPTGCKQCTRNPQSGWRRLKNGCTATLTPSEPSPQLTTSGTW